MEPAFWLAKWQTNQIGFHEDFVHPLLEQHWKDLALPVETTVLVPLCGKSRDMLWLRNRGHEVVGVEISDIAVRAFFTENGLQASCEQRGAFQLYRAPGYTLWCGDFFALTRALAGTFAGIYDRAALIALPAPMRGAYVAHLQSLCDHLSTMLVVTLEYADDLIDGPPFSLGENAVRELYAPWCRWTRLGSGASTVKGIACRETAHRLVVA